MFWRKVSIKENVCKWPTKTPTGRKGRWKFNQGFTWLTTVESLLHVNHINGRGFGPHQIESVIKFSWPELLFKSSLVAVNFSFLAAEKKTQIIKNLLLNEHEVWMVINQFHALFVSHHFYVLSIMISSTLKFLSWLKSPLITFVKFLSIIRQ